MGKKVTKKLNRMDVVVELANVIQGLLAKGEFVYLEGK